MGEAQPSDNGVAYIQKLPFEIIRRILQLEPAFSDRTYAYRLQTLRLVHPVWRDVIEKSCCLWNRIDSIYPIHVVRLILERSKSAKLKIICDFTEATTSNYPNHRDFARELLPYSTRCESFVGMGMRCPAIFQGFLAASTTAMTSVDVRLKALPLNVLFTIKFGDGPPLNVVESRSISFDWDSPRLSNMTRLTLQHITQPPSLNQLADILSCSLNIVSLTLKGFDTPPGSNLVIPSLPQRPPIVLPKLKWLLMTMLPAEYYYQLLPRLRVSECRHVILGNPKHRLQEFDLDSRLFAGQEPGLYCLLRTPFVEAPFIRVRVRSSDDLVVGTPKTPHVDHGLLPCLVILSHLPFGNKITDAGRFISSMNLNTPVELRLEKPGVPPSVLLHLPNLRGLHLDHSIDFLPFINYLTDQKLHPGEAEPRWVAPNLEIIEMTYGAGTDAEGDAAALRKLINDRWNNPTHYPAVPKLFQISKIGRLPSAFRDVVGDVKSLVEVALREIEEVS